MSIRGGVNMVEINSFFAGVLIAFAFYHGIYLFFREKKYDHDQFSQLGQGIPLWAKRSLSITFTLLLVVLMSYAVVELAEAKDKFDQLGCAAYCKQVLSFGLLGQNYTYDITGIADNSSPLAEGQVYPVNPA